MVATIGTDAFSSRSKPFKIVIGIRKSTEDMRSLFQTIGEYWFATNKQAIFSQRGASGRFKDLTPVTKDLKQKNYGNAYPILVATGKLRDSLTNPLDRNAIFRIRKTSLTLGSNVDYLKYHMTGFKHYQTGRFVSPRPPISLTAGGLQSFIRKMSDVTSHYFEARLRKPI
ncbi:MAG: hypothetical protein NTV01_01800 [Bacteroidia bacterium]|nr:hypothetical protein [Bacteroidia bacterium]